MVHICPTSCCVVNYVWVDDVVGRQMSYLASVNGIVFRRQDRTVVIIYAASHAGHVPRIKLHTVHIVWRALQVNLSIASLNLHYNGNKAEQKFRNNILIESALVYWWRNIMSLTKARAQCRRPLADTYQLWPYQRIPFTNLSQVPAISLSVFSWSANLQWNRHHPQRAGKKCRMGAASIDVKDCNFSLFMKINEIEIALTRYVTVIGSACSWDCQLTCH